MAVVEIAVLRTFVKRDFTFVRKTAITRESRDLAGEESSGRRGCGSLHQ